MPLTLLLLAACPGDDGDVTGLAGTTSATGSGATATDSMPATSSTPTEGAADATGSATDGSTADATSGTADATGGTSDGTTGPTTSTTGMAETDGPGELMMLCEGFCENWTECYGEPPSPDCVGVCVMTYQESQGEPCASAVAQYLACVGGAACESLENGGCDAASEEMNQACDFGEECFDGVSQGRDPQECSWGRSCPDQVPLEMQCMADTCTCLTDGQPVGMCAADGVCMDLNDLPAKASECCGF